MKLRVLLFSISLSLLSLNLKAADSGAACGGIIDKIERAMSGAKALLRESRFQPVVVERAPIHVSSFPGLPSLLVSFPGEGVDHLSIDLTDRFGFANGTSRNPSESRSMIPPSQLPGFNLRSLDVVGNQGFVVASYVRGKELALIPAIATNLPDTTSLDPLPAAQSALSIKDIADVDENFVVSTRLGSHEFLITDGSNKIRIVQLLTPKREEKVILDKVSLELTATVDITDETRALDVRSVEKIQFFGSSKYGYIRTRIKGDYIALIPFHAEFDENGNIQQIKTDAARAKVFDGLDKVYRTTAHPTESLVFVAEEDSFLVYELNTESGDWRLVRKMDVSSYLDQEESNLGIEFFLAPDHQGQLEVRGAILAGSQDASARRTKLIFFKIGQP